MSLRVILDVDDFGDLQRCLSLAIEQQRVDNDADFGYWSSKDPAFSAYIRSTKTGVSVRGRRHRDSDGSGKAGETGTGSTEGDSAGLQGVAQLQSQDPSND